VVVTLLALAATQVGAADVFVGTPPFNPETGEQVAIELLVDVGSDVLGSYFVDFEYDPAVVHIFSVAGGTTGEFSSGPTTNPATFGSGVTPLAAAQGDTSSPTGFVSVATVTLSAVGLPADGSDLDLTVHSLFDGAVNALPSNVFPSSVLVGVPLAATDLSFSDKISLNWTPSAGIPAYNVYRGTFDSAAFSYDHACFQPDLLVSTAVDSELPALAGTGFYYLISAERNGIEGSLGAASFGPVRPNLSSCASAAPVSNDRALRTVPWVVEPRPNHGLGSSRTVRLVTDGDVDGDGLLSASDATAILESLVGTRSLGERAAVEADVDGNGVVDVADAQSLRQFLASGVRVSRAWSESPVRGMAVVLGSSDCRPVELIAGLNATRLRCLPDDYSAHEMLEDLGGDQVVRAIQKFDRDSNRYLTASFSNGVPIGDDFPILEAESYMIVMNMARAEFVPARIKRVGVKR